MRRRDFLRSSAAGALALGASASIRAADDSPLGEHRITSVEFRDVPIPWPRFVGKNSSKGHHGRGPNASVAVLGTDRGAAGWGQLQTGRKQAEELRDKLVGRTVASVLDPATGIRSDDWYAFDIPLHDLAGVILNQPVWRMLGADEPFVTKVYSGMIYFDDLDPEDDPDGIDKVLENCRWDRDHGYRQLKVKIGRGNKWMPAEAGLQRDIDVVNAIHQAFPDIEILVDGNNGFTVETMIRFLKGIDGVPLFWIEEPFHETLDDWRRLSRFLEDNGRAKTLCADGEARPDTKVLDELGTEGTLDVRLEDICGLGFTRWRQLMPKLREQGVDASPHTWGSGLKTVYTAHFAAAVGHHPTVEGVTCRHDHVDFGENRIEKGRFQPSTQPGFGLTLKKV